MYKQKALKAAAALCLLCLPFLTHAQTGSAVFQHAALCSKDLKKSTEFYTTVLKLKVIPHPFKDTVHTWYSIAPGIQMHVIQGACSLAPKLIGDHLCFSVPSVPDFAKRLVAMNIPYSNWKGVPNQIEHRIDGVSQIYFQDPDGYWIEINDSK